MAAYGVWGEGMTFNTGIRGAKLLVMALCFLGIGAVSALSGEDYYDDMPPSESEEVTLDLPPMQDDRAGESAEGQMVVAIDVLNTITTTPEQIRYRMSTRVGHPLKENILDGDFQRLTEMGIFEDIQIKKEFVNGGVRIIVAVRERDIIRRIEFRGYKQVKQKKLNSLIESKVGERYDAGKTNRDRRAIEDFYHKEFYYFADLETEVEPFEDGVRLVFDINEGGRLYVQDIQFRGNTVFTRKELLKNLETKRSGVFTRGKYLRRQFERDLEKIRFMYLNKGYLDVKVIERPFQITSNTPSSKWQRRDAYLTVDIEEGESYQVGRVNINFEGTSLVSEEQVRSVMKTMPGGVYSPLTTQEDANTIRDIYGQYPNSRYFTKVFPEPEVTEDGPIMDVTFHIAEGPEVTIEGIRVQGLTRTKEVVVLREFEVFPGQKMDSRAFNRSKENIKNLAYFDEKTMKIDVREGSGPDRAVIVAEVEEVPTGKLSAGVGLSSRDNITATIGLSQRNFDYKDWPKSFKDFYTGKSFRGMGQYFSINLTKGRYTDRYVVDFTNPWAFGKPISFMSSLFYDRQEWDDYVERRIGTSVGFGKRHLFGFRPLSASLTYRLESVKLTNIPIGSIPEITAEEGSHWMNRWIGNIGWDTRDSSWETTKGTYTSLTYELAGKPAAGSRDFWRAFFSTQIFIPVFEDKQERRWTLGLRGDIGIAQAYGRDDDVPVFERMYAGGIGSIRGFDSRGIAPRSSDPNYFYSNQRAGGEATATGSAEFFVPIYDKIIRASTFYDIGTVWSKLGSPSEGQYYEGIMGDLGYGYDGNRMWRSSFGFGLHIKIPLGPAPVRLYYSFPGNSRDRDSIQRFQFAMGALF